jgi:hypothetical protein
VSVAGGESGGDDTRAFGDGTIGLVRCNGSGRVKVRLVDSQADAGHQVPAGKTDCRGEGERRHWRLLEGCGSHRDG